MAWPREIAKFNSDFAAVCVSEYLIQFILTLFFLFIYFFLFARENFMFHVTPETFYSNVYIYKLCILFFSSFYYKAGLYKT